MEQTASAENTPKPESPLKKQRGTNRKEHPMKELNRREFLTLSGAAVVALSLAGCGGGSSAPAAPTGKEAKVLEALNLYRKEKKLEPYQMDEGLNGLAEEAAKFALGEIEEVQLMHKILAVADFNGGLYVNPRRPLGVIDKGDPTMSYSEDIEVMKNALLALKPADTNDNIGPAEVKLVGIKVFTAKDGNLYWVAMGAESKKTA